MLGGLATAVAVLLGGFGDAHARDSVPNSAAAGTLDRSFSGDGVATTAFKLRIAMDEAHAVVALPNGGLIAAGTSNGAVALARYLPDGSLDPSFANHGRVVTALSQPITGVAGVALTGGDVVVGTSDNEHFLLVGYDLNGNLDSSFGNQGVAATSVPYPANMVALLPGPGDELTAAGTSANATVIARYRSNGSPDPSFGAGGVAIDQGHPGLTAAGLAPDGSMLAAADTKLVRYTPAGAVDSSFGAGGSVDLLSLFGTDTTHENQFGPVAVQPDGKILVGATACLQLIKGRSCRWTLARLNPDGSVDQSFGTSGFVDLSALRGLQRILVEPDGRIVVRGIGFARLLPSGAFDPSFGSGGIANPAAPKGHGGPFLAMAPAGDGIALAGSASTYPAHPEKSPDFLVARLRSDGSADPSFGDRGFVRTGFPAPPQIAAAGAQAIVSRPNGKLVGVGAFDDWSREVLAQYRRDGSLDRSFGKRGRVIGANVGGSLDVVDAVRTGRGNVLVASDRAERAEVTSYRANGGVDRRYGRRGSTFVPKAELSGPADETLLNPNGRLLLTGNVPEYVALKASGARDRAFGRHGVASTSRLFGHTRSGRATGGGFYVAGRVRGGKQALGVVRFTGSGHVDRSFGHQGLAQLNQQVSNASPMAVFGLRRGVLVVGQALTPGAESSVLIAARFHRDGSPDRAFGHGGVAVLQSPPGAVYVTAVVEPHGRLVAVGQQTFGDVALLRLTPRGRRDSRFGADGSHVQPLPRYGEDLTAATLAPGGRIAVAGKLLEPGDAAGLRSRMFVAVLHG